MDMDLEQLQREMQTSASDSMTFIVKRDHPEPGRTFSAESLDSIENQVRLFIGSRIMHAIDSRRPEFDAKGHEVIQVAVKVYIDQRHHEPPEGEYPWYSTVDGSVREKVLP